MVHLNNLVCKSFLLYSSSTRQPALGHLESPDKISSRRGLATYGLQHGQICLEGGCKDCILVASLYSVDHPNSIESLYIRERQSVQVICVLRLWTRGLIIMIAKH